MVLKLATALGGRGHRVLLCWCCCPSTKVKNRPGNPGGASHAALRSIVRRDTGERAHKGSNQDWVNPHDPDARVTKMKDGRTHLAHKAEHAVDLETGAVVAVTLAAATKATRRRFRKQYRRRASTSPRPLVQRRRSNWPNHRLNTEREKSNPTTGC